MRQTITIRFAAAAIMTALLVLVLTDNTSSNGDPVVRLTSVTK